MALHLLQTSAPPWTAGLVALVLLLGALIWVLVFGASRPNS